MAKATASERATRLLAMLHLLRPDAEISLGAIADALGITPAEAADELVTLSCCGVAPYTPDALVPLSVEGDVAIVFGPLPALERAVRLSGNQAEAVLAALQAAGLGADDPLWQKLRSVATDDATDAERFERILASAPDDRTDETLKSASLAIAEGRVMSLSYQGSAETSPRDRVVEPVALLNERGHWYLEAYARDAGALRTFRLDRVRTCAVLPERCPDRSASPSGAAIATDGLPLATLRLDVGEEATSRDWPGMRVVSRDAEGTLIEVPYAGAAWIARQVLSRLGAATVIEPPEVRDAVRELAEANLAAS